MPKIDAVILSFSLMLVCVLAVLLIRRKVYREFPFFFAYVLSSVLILVFKLSVIGNYLSYFKVYWVGEAFYAVGTLFVLYEAFRWVFYGFHELWWFQLLFPVVVVIISAIAVTSALRHPPAQAPQIVGVILSFGSAVGYLKASIFCLFVLLVLLFGLRWRSYPFGIVLGFAASGFGAWFAYVLRSQFGTKFNFLSKYIVSVAYLCGVALWLGTFARQDPELAHAWPSTKTPEEMLEEVRRYVRIMKGLGKNKDE